MKVLHAFAFATLLTAAAFAQPRISRVQNNYSYILPGMPNYGIAQGSIFDIFGSGLATATSQLQGVPLPRSLNGASVDITVSGTTTQAILYFVSAAQIAAILPSATPTGTGQITVTVSGQKSAPAAITVIQSAFGLLSLNGVGNGPAAVFDLSSNYLGITNAANPGDFITLWGSGLGPVTGDETQTQTPATLAGTIPIEVDIGGTIATIQYAGRSIYPGLDQINVQVPPGPTGCHISVVVRTGDIVSNFGSIPVATSGRTCSEPFIGLTAGKLQSLLSQPAITRGVIDFVNSTSGSSADVTFGRFTNAQYATKEPIGFTSMYDCVVYNYTNTNMAIPNPIKPAFLNAGPSINITTPNGSASMPFQDGGYSVDNLPMGSSLKGAYTYTGTGGPDIGAFTAQVTWPGGGGGFTSSTPGNPTSVARSKGLTVTWSQPSNTDPAEYIQIGGYAFVPNAANGAEFACSVPLSAGRFTVPPAVLLALPPQVGLATPQATLEVDLFITQQFTAPGADYGLINFLLQTIGPFSYQ